MAEKKVVARVGRVNRRVEVELAEEVVTVMASGAGLDESKRETISVRKFVTDPAYVRMSAGSTINMGDYESLRVDVAITLPCYVEEIEAVQDRLGAMVNERLNAEIEQYTGGK